MIPSDFQMKSVGEVMAIGRSFTEAIQKACQSLENERSRTWLLWQEHDACRRTAGIYQDAEMGPDFPDQRCPDGRYSVGTYLSKATNGIDRWFLYQIQKICTIVKKKLPNMIWKHCPMNCCIEAKVNWLQR
jgi:carbamoyl-phosphate synthase large subunit